MNREILFRGKSPITRNWVTGDLFQHGEQRFIMADNRNTEVIPETVGQYTGKELDGKKIFTGDIVQTCVDYDDNLGYPATDVFNSVVIWDEENFCFAFKTDDYIQSFNDWDWDCSGVIGNIHDNPELLEV